MKRKTKRWRAFAACALAMAAVGGQAQGQTSEALVNTLVKKGILTADEAKEITADLGKEAKAASKWKLSSSITELELFGDARLRYEFREGQNLDGDTLARERFRYRLRFGFKGDFKEDFYYGLRLETSSRPRSTNVTFGDDGGGPSHKDSDRIHVGQIYLGWKGLDWLTLEAGRMANPLVTTPMVWDPDISPEGAMEKFTHSIGKFDLFATLGQFLYDDVNPENPIGPGKTRADAFLLAWQVGTKYTFNEKMSLQVAPVLYTYTGKGDYGGPFGSGATPNVTGINDLRVLEVPVEFGFEVGKFPARVFGDFAINLDGRDRAKAAGFADKDDENKAYLIGAGLGKVSRKGSWEARAWWQHAELFALDANLVDTDAFDSKVNMEGFVVTFRYAITDNISGQASYAYGDQINNGLPTLGGGDIGIGTLKDYQCLQLDLNWRF
jgi:hypothetical protein